MCKCAVGKIRVEWDEVVTLGIAELQGASFQDVVCKLALGAAYYNIWKHRNDIRHGNKLNSEEQILKRIDWEVRTRNTGSRNLLIQLQTGTSTVIGECLRRCVPLSWVGVWCFSSDGLSFRR